MASLGEFFVKINSVVDSKGFEKARDSINKIALAGTAMAGALTAAALKSAQVAGVQEKAEISLAQAMKTAGTFTQESFQHNLNYASSLQKMTTYGDEAIIGVQRLLTNFGIEGEELDKVTKATLDLAAAKGMDLQSAADLVAKSIGSSTNALSRYGITIEGSAGSTERASQAVAAISRLFGGAAQANAKSYLGQLTQLRNRWADIVEKIGKFVIPIILSLADLLNKEVLPRLENLLIKLQDTGEGSNFLSNSLKILISIVQGVIAAFDLAGQATAIFALVLSGHFNAAKQGWDNLKKTVISYGDTFTRIANMEIGKRNEVVRDFINTEQIKSITLADQNAARLLSNETTENYITNLAMENAEYRRQIAEQLKIDEIKYADEVERNRLKSFSNLSRSFTDSMSLMITESKSFTESFKAFTKDMADYFIKQVSRMIAKQLALLALRAATGGFVSFFQHGVKNFQGGLVMVGETGPELLNLPKGSSVISNSQSKNLMERAGGGTSNIIVNVPPIGSRQEARRLGNILGQELFNRVKQSRRI